MFRDLFERSVEIGRKADRRPDRAGGLHLHAFSTPLCPFHIDGLQEFTTLHHVGESAMAPDGPKTLAVLTISPSTVSSVRIAFLARRIRLRTDCRVSFGARASRKKALHQRVLFQCLLNFNEPPIEIRRYIFRNFVETLHNNRREIRGYSLTLPPRYIDEHLRILPRQVVNQKRGTQRSGEIAKATQLTADALRRLR